MQFYTSVQISSTLAHRLEAMPKVEIHVHLEGATDAETIYEMAKRNQVELPVASLDEWKKFYKFRDFNHFIQVYVTASKCIQTPDDYVLMVERFIKHQSEQNIRYSEAFVSVSLHSKKLTDDELLAALSAGMSAGEAKYNSRVNFIADISREYPDTQSKVLEFALKGQEKGIIIGLGLGGIELGNPAQNFAETYKEAKRQGLRVVAHAGEADGAQSIRGAIESLHAERIGHGIRCLEDAELLEELHHSQIPLEVSPQSNYCLGSVPRHQQHPIRQMIDAGLYCTLNSDDPAMFSTSLYNEYVTLAAQGFSWEELWQLNLNTLEASFLSETEKAKYRDQWQEFLLCTHPLKT
ncbi:adenosine deaminase [Mastigocladopsis repens]|uniref:adenosine deaminase n=1 Tax=Mastigocladopsis repens TaxID=221287 RepID=UPI0002D6BFE2|nr:adenosine deaminase [Mastigocladopsis repens]